MFALKGTKNNSMRGSDSASHLELEHCLDHSGRLRVISQKKKNVSDRSNLSFDWGGSRAKPNGLALKKQSTHTRVHTHAHTDVKMHQHRINLGFIPQ